ncbi:MAG: hypothetical protein ACFFAO_19445 [Candidatus Hermodarchaeota archaeon]
METEEFKKQIEMKDQHIESLKDQIQTIKDSLELKDEQIKIFESNIKSKDDKIRTLESTLKLKEEEIKNLDATSVDESLIVEKDKEIEDLRKEIELLNDELAKADEDLEKLTIENEKLRKNSLSTSGTKIIDFTSVKISREEIIKEMKSILEKAVHSVIIAIPKIEDLNELYLYEVRSSVAMKISCEINPGIEEHIELLDEYESLDNISLRNFDGADRYILNRDGEELLMAIKGMDEDNHLVFKTRDSAHIKLLNPTIMESWLRSRKI